jgi:hypothetical protein
MPTAKASSAAKSGMFAQGPPYVIQLRQVRCLLAGATHDCEYAVRQIADHAICFAKTLVQCMDAHLSFDE